MMREELEIQEDRVDLLMSGLGTFAAFSLACSLPFFPYIMAYFIFFKAFPLSVGMTGTDLFVVGVARQFMTRRPWWRSGLECLGMGGLVAACAY